MVEKTAAEMVASGSCDDGMLFCYTGTRVTMAADKVDLHNPSIYDLTINTDSIDDDETCSIILATLSSNSDN